MSTDFSGVHEELRAVARDLLGKTSPRGGMAAARGTAGNTAENAVADLPAADWSLIAESGWLGLEVPEELDGAGATFAEVAVILTEMGRAAALSPYLGTAVLGVGALGLAEPGAGRDELLREVAAGGLRLAVALPTGDGLPVDDGDPPYRVEASAGGLRLHGRAEFVPDATEADQLLLLALDPDGVPVLARVEAGRPGVEVAAQPVLDPTRRLGVVTAAGAAVDAGSLWRFRGGVADAEAAGAAAAVRRLLDRGALAVACDSLGVAEAMLEATVAYAGVRQQFGRPIGSFQAVKHACADMLVQITVGRELLAAAVRALAAGDPEAGTAVSRAKSYVCGAATDIVGKAMQLHGGIGYTWESGVHVYFKRALLNRSLFGAPAAHRRRLARRFV